MTTPNLTSLEALTRDYAAFQSRKSGLATALGGFLVLIQFPAALHEVFGFNVLNRPILECFLLLPLLWLTLKSLVARILYRSLGIVKAVPDRAYERRLWFWVLGLALFLMILLTVVVYGFISGFLAETNPIMRCLSKGHPFSHPWTWLIWMPMLYLAPMPWAIRGIEEARAYTVLVAQCMLWQIPVFMFAFVTIPSPHNLSKWAELLFPLGSIGLTLGILIWAALAMIRGWKEHRQYLAILRALPRES